MGTERIKRGQKLCLPDVTGPMGQFSNVESRTFHTAGTVHGVGGGWGLQHSGRLGPGEGAEAAGSTALSRDRGGTLGRRLTGGGGRKTLVGRGCPGSDAEGPAELWGRAENT